MNPPTSKSSAIIFPDDFVHRDVLELVGQLRRRRPHLLPVLITRDPIRYRAAIGQDPRRPHVVVLPRPSFGWEILDAIRAHAEATGPR